jgi:hypothetical protein
MRAIASYHQNTPGEIKQYPVKLEDLLEDHRFPKPMRHLRQIFIDPMTGSRDWGLIEEGGRIIGVYSQSEAVPHKRANFPLAFEVFKEAKSYQEWKFRSVLGATVATSNAAPVAGVAIANPVADAPVNAAEPPKQPVPVSGGNETPQLPTAEAASASSNCQYQYVIDRQGCQNACTVYAAPGCSACLRSALARLAACRRGDALPALATP